MLVCRITFQKVVTKMFIQTGFRRPMLLAAASVAFHSVALSQQTQTQSIHFQLTPADLPIAASHGTYKLSIAGTKGRDWILGVVFDASRKPAIQLGQVVFGSPMHPGLMRPVSSVTSVPPSQINISRSSLTMNGFEGNSLVGFMILPTNFQFELEVDGVPVDLTQASGTLLIRNGTLLPVPVRGLHTVMGQLYSSSPGKNDPKLTRTP